MTISRYFTFALVGLLTILTLAFAPLWPQLLWLASPLTLLTVLGIWDLVQDEHSLLRNYPVLGHMRWLFEGIRPEIRQYLIESDRDEVPSVHASSPPAPW